MPALSNREAALAALAAGRPALVWQRLIADTETPVGAAVKLIEPSRGDFLLESVQGGEVRRRYSLLGLDPDLAEVSFGDQEGQPMGDWYDDWIEGRYTPADGESFRELLDRAVRGLNRALAQPAPVLVVAHGALFRALRLALGHEPNVRTPNALPMHITPPPDGGKAWGIAPAALA